jgi:hypothetical protein
MSERYMAEPRSAWFKEISTFLRVRALPLAINIPPSKALFCVKVLSEMVMIESYRMVSAPPS